MVISLQNSVTCDTVQVCGYHDSDGTCCFHVQGRLWRWRRYIALTKTVRFHSPQFHILTLLFFSPSVATRCFCWHYEIFRSNIHTSYADTHWQLIRLRYSYTHVSYYEEVTVSADLYGCEIWTVEEIDKKINWVHEIRFVKYCYGERILDAAKNVRRNVKVRSYFVFCFVFTCASRIKQFDFIIFRSAAMFGTM